MRTVNFSGWPTAVSALGFGCASLGSRISRKDAIAAVERALAAGVTWFDVAPAYGGGEAEAILGEALAASKVAIATKVGLVARPASAQMKNVRALVRPLIARSSMLRRFVRGLRRGSVLRAPLTGEAIRASLARSLERLKVDRVALFALHEPTLEEVRRPDVIRALNDAKDDGLAVRIGVAGSHESFLAARAAGMAADVLQTADSPFNPDSEEIRNIALQGNFMITHSVFGCDGRLDRLRRALRQDAALRRAVEALGRNSHAAAIPGILLDYAFAANPKGIVLLSSIAPKHLAFNAAAAGREPTTSLAAIIDGNLAPKRNASHASNDGSVRVKCAASRAARATAVKVGFAWLEDGKIEEPARKRFDTP